MAVCRYSEDAEQLAADQERVCDPAEWPERQRIANTIGDDGAFIVRLEAVIVVPVAIGSAHLFIYEDPAGRRRR